MPQLKKIEKGFLYKNQSLKTLTLSLPQLNQVGDWFLSKNESLKTVTLSLPQLTQVGDFFLYSNRRLEALSLNLPQLKQVEDYFLYNCEQLKSVDLRSLLKLEKVEAVYLILRNSAVNTFMGNMPKLEEVLIDARPKEFFKELLKDKHDLLPKFKVVA
ncbi:MAG: hypothetical protein C0582_02955 [Alphaproteobacteria bacterium]|nr:MAG: hypothetical protein C0582_02955 [Alphaproteobacteria bacterium]